MAYRRWERAVASALRLSRNRPGVVGVDFGFAYKDGVRLKTRAARFHVSQKIPIAELRPEHVLPAKIDNFRSDVVQARYSLHASPRQVCDPIQPGVSIGNVQRSTTGTTGLAVKLRATGAAAILSNWHVLCGSNEARTGEQICQPGPLHLGSNAPRLVANLERWIELDVGCDAAVAVLNSGIAIDNRLFDSTVVVTGTQSAGLGQKVVKYGSTSGLTHGMIDGVGGSFQIDYSAYGDTRRWIDALRIVADPDITEAEISLAGDSGAAWTDPSGRAVGLHFAGEDGLGPTADYALAQPLQKIFDLLDIDI
jgi:hypothetical protein